MPQEFTFEVEPFRYSEVDGQPLSGEWEQAGFESEEEAERGRVVGRGPARSRLRARTPMRPRRPPRRPIPRRRPPRPPKPWPRPYGQPQWLRPGIVVERFPDYSAEPASGEDVRFAQDCLNRALGLQLPVTGVTDAATRSAVRSFQRQRGLAVNGIVGPETKEALATACGQGAPASDTGASDTGAGDTADGDTGASDAGAGDTGAGDTGDAEFGGPWGFAETMEGEEEVKISAPYEVILEKRPQVSIPDEDALQQLPGGPKGKGMGIYVIYVDNVAWYVGKASNIRARFQERFKAFRDFKIPVSALQAWLQRVKVLPYVMTVPGPPTARGLKSGAPRSKPQALLVAVEGHFIDTLQTLGKNKGNKVKEPVCFIGNGAVKISYAGSTDVETVKAQPCR